MKDFLKKREPFIHAAVLLSIVGWYLCWGMAYLFWVTMFFGSVYGVLGIWFVRLEMEFPGKKYLRKGAFYFFLGAFVFGSHEILYALDESFFYNAPR